MSFAGRPARTWPEDAPPIKARHVTLIGKKGRDLVWACNVGEKRDLVANASPGPLWACWTGEWSSHLFVIERSQARQELRT